MEETRSSLTRLLDEAGLLCYEQKLRTLLKLREACDVVYVDEKDFVVIGMTRPEQKRLRAAYNRLYPRATIMGKLKQKLLGSTDTVEAKKVEVVQSEEDQHVIPLEKIELTKQLGKGEFGLVHQAVWTNCSNERIQVAAKCVSTLKLSANSSSFLQEAAIMHKMRHEFVVRLYGVVLDTKTVMLISELAPCGALLECLRNPSLKETFFVDTLCEFSLQIALGMKYLASKRLVHRDLAARNVLVFSSNKVKIADFGLSRLLGVGEYYYRGDLTEGMKLPIAWCAPESINFLRFTSASDVWSFGVTLYELFSYGQTPWVGLTGTEILSAVDYPRNERLKCPNLCPVDFYKLMLQCWAYKPEERPTFSDIVDHLNDVSPQSVLTVAACTDGVADHLQHAKNEVIIVLDKQPSAYPDGYYWKGCIRDGRKGLFRPSNTVVRLGAEKPCSSALSVGSLLSNGNSASEQNKEKDKKKKRKVVISEPQNDLRHTCHIGIDGTSFGLIPNADLVTGHSVLSDASAAFPGLCSQSRSARSGNSSLAHSPTVENSTLSCPESVPSRGVAFNERTSSCSTAVTSFTDLDATSDSVFTDQLLIALPRNPKSVNTTAALPYHGGGVANETVRKDTFDDDTSTITEVLNELNLITTSFSLSGSSGIDDVSESRPLITREKTLRLDTELASCAEQFSVCRVMSEGELQRWEGRVDREHLKASKILNQERSKEFELWRRSSLSNKEDRSGEKLSRSFSNSISTKAPSEWSEEAQNAYTLLVQCGNNLKYGSVPLAQQASEGGQVSGTKNVESKKLSSKDESINCTSRNGNASPALPPRGRKIDLADNCEMSPLRQLRLAKGTGVFKFQGKSAEEVSKDSDDALNRRRLSDDNPSIFSGNISKTTECVEIAKTTDARKPPSDAARLVPPRPLPRVPPPVPPKPKKCMPSNEQDGENVHQRSFASAVANSVLFAGMKTEEVMNF